MLKNLQQMRLKLLRKEQFKKTAETTCDLISNKVTDRITKVSRNSQENKSEKVTNEHDKVMPKKRYISPGERQDILKCDQNSIIIEYKKQQKQLVIQLVIKLLIKLRFQKIYSRIIQKQENMIKKYLKKVTYL